jgi:hypothetical protein
MACGPTRPSLSIYIFYIYIGYLYTIPRVGNNIPYPSRVGPRSIQVPLHRVRFFFNRFFCFFLPVLPHVGRYTSCIPRIAVFPRRLQPRPPPPTDPVLLRPVLPPPLRTPTPRPPATPDPHQPAIPFRHRGLRSSSSKGRRRTLNSSASACASSSCVRCPPLIRPA